MATRTRPVDRGTDRGRRILIERGTELRAARVDRGLTLAAVGKAARMSASKLSRIERGLALSTTILDLARLHAIVGLDLSVRSFAGGPPIRDAAQVALLGRLRDLLHATLRWSVEVPLPLVGDQRAWDAVVVGTGWRFGVEAETAPRDVQALVRRLRLKVRDGGVDGVVLVLPDTRHTRAFQREAGDVLSSDFPVPGPAALAALRSGQAPKGNAIIVM